MVPIILHKGITLGHNFSKYALKIKSIIRVNPIHWADVTSICVSCDGEISMTG